MYNSLNLNKEFQQNRRNALKLATRFTSAAALAGSALAATIDDAPNTEPDGSHAVWVRVFRIL